MMKAPTAKTDRYQRVLASIIDGCHFKNYLEIGCWDGQTLLFVMDHCPDMVSLTGIDIRVPDNRLEPRVDSRIRWLFGCSSDEFFASNIQRFDCIFLDADHREEQVLIDFRNALACLENDGLVFLHDVYPPNVEMAGMGNCGTAYLAYLQIAKELGEYEIVNLPLYCGLAIVRKFSASQRLVIDGLPLTRKVNHVQASC